MSWTGTQKWLHFGFSHLSQVQGGILCHFSQNALPGVRAPLSLLQSEASCFPPLHDPLQTLHFLYVGLFLFFSKLTELFTASNIKAHNFCLRVFHSCLGCSETKLSWKLPAQVLLCKTDWFISQASSDHKAPGVLSGIEKFPIFSLPFSVYT